MEILCYSIPQVLDAVACILAHGAMPTSEGEVPILVIEGTGLPESITRVWTTTYSGKNDKGGKT